MTPSHSWIWHDMIWGFFLMWHWRWCESKHWFLEKWPPDLEFWQVLWFFVNLATNHSVQVTCLNSWYRNRWFMLTRTQQFVYVMTKVEGEGVEKKFEGSSADEAIGNRTFLISHKDCENSRMTLLATPSGGICGSCTRSRPLSQCI